MKNPNGRIVALDVGSKRIGVASANVVARLASPLTTIQVSEHVMEEVAALLAQQTAVAVVLGLPRGLDGQDTAQTNSVRKFAEELKKSVTVKIFWQDEALTSRLSRLELSTKKGQHNKGAVDALAATYILEDFLASHESMEFTS